MEVSSQSDEGGEGAGAPRALFAEEPRISDTVGRYRRRTQPLSEITKRKLRVNRRYGTELRGYRDFIGMPEI